MRLAFHSVQGQPVLWLSRAAGGRTPITRLDKYWSRGLYRPLAIHLSSQDGVGFIMEAWLQTWCQIPLLFVGTVLKSSLGSVLDDCTYLTRRWPTCTYCASKRLYPGNGQAPIEIKNDCCPRTKTAIHSPWGRAWWYAVMTGGVYMSKGKLRCRSSA